jgi:phage portal protein BeeE
MSGVITSLVVRRNNQELVIQKDRQASPANLPQGGAIAAGYTWDGKVPVQNARVYRHWAKTSEWVRGAVQIRRTQVSSAEWDIVPFDQRRPYSKRQQDVIRKLFRQPNPANDSYRGFIEPVTDDLLILDAGCVEKVRDLSGNLRELWPTNAAQIKVNAMWDGNPNTARYFWYPDGINEKARWTNEDFIYMMMNPRTDSPVGLPALETLRASVEAELAASEYNRRQVENAAPDGIINLGEGFTEPQVEKFRDFFESEVAGRGPLGFIGGSKAPSFIKFRDSNRDQQFLEWQIYLVRKIAVVFGLTPQDLGVTFDVNRSTSEIQMQVSEDRGLRPLMSNIQEYLTEEVVWDKSFGGMANNLAFRFTALNLKESTAKAAIYEKALAGVPWRFINEARLDEGREPIPEMEGKLIMATPQGAVDISDVPTVREMLEMQQASKAVAASSSKSAEEMATALAPLIVKQVLDAQPKKNSDIDLIGVVTGIQSLFKDHFERDRQDSADHTELLLKAVNQVQTTRAAKTPDINRDGNNKTVEISFSDEPKRTVIERDANGRISGVRQEPAP